MGAITCALRHVLRDDDLRFGVDGDLGIVGLHEAVLALHDPALWIGEVLLGFGVRRWGRLERLSGCLCAGPRLPASRPQRPALSTRLRRAAFASTSNSALLLRQAPRPFPSC